MQIILHQNFIHKPQPDYYGLLRSFFRTVYRAAGLEVRACRTGETDASDACGSGGTDWNRQAEYLLDTWGNSVLRLAYSYLQNPSDAEDILQDTLVQYLRVRPQLKDETHEKAWMLRVAANLSKNRIAYNRIREADPLDEQLAARQRPDLSFVWDAVKQLPQQYREAIHLFYCEDCSVAQIARILDKKEVSVRSDLRRGRLRLKQILREEYDFDEEI
ncbi:MAG: RNA polymerase sigma factor [Anaerovoracaceae bacterium]